MGKSIVAATPVMKQFMDVKAQYADAIVLFRMGDFYETFLEDAEITAKILGIVLTKRANGKAADVPLAGFPYHALDNYLHKLVKAGHRVAICEQVEDPKLAKGIVKREVTEVVTPGTLMSDKALSEKSNQFISSLTFNNDDHAGFAVLDSSTGEFHLGECPTEKIKESLLQFSPSEVVLGERIVYSLSDWYIELKPFVTQVDDWIFDQESSYRTLTQHFNLPSLKGFGCDDFPLGISAAGALMHHIKTNLSMNLDHISTVTPVLSEGVMGLDGFTMKNLEVFQSLSTQGTHGTLVDCFDNTLTAGGGRIFRQWLHRPLTDKKRLDKRLDLVLGFTTRKQVLVSIRKSLKNSVDIERILGKINQGKASPRDVVGLAEMLDKIPAWKKHLAESADTALQTFSSLFVDASSMVGKIRETLNEEAPIQLTQGNIIKTGFNSELDELRILLKGGKDWITNFQEAARRELGISSLKVGYNKVFGYYIEVTKVHQEKVPSSYIRKQTLVNSERYITEELKEYEEKIISAEEDIFEIEANIFRELNRFILAENTSIHTNAKLINRLDLLCGFAATASKRNYTRPVLTHEPVLEIKKGRHPVVEQLLPATEKFIPNDLNMDGKKNQIHLITGPNMAGKSTYLRQVGLIVLMAQIGSFVPAKSAKIGIVDRLFTRVGASDNLAGGESTFLVEMNEAANILNNATDQSLILLDEIGRGTSTFDGLSLAWAITEYLHDAPGVNARTLFATHYHELTDLGVTLDRLENHYVEVKEFGDRIIFLRSIAKGTGDKSYGIHVARMAGLPKSVIHRATEILNHHISQSLERDDPALPPDSSDQLTLFQEQESRLRKDLNTLDVNSLTPLEALQKLDELKKDHGL